MEFEESVYNLIPKERYDPPKQNRHQSAHPWHVPPTASTFCLKTTSKPGVANLNGDVDPRGSNHSPKGAALTMGRPMGSAKEETNNFRKKGTGTFKLPESKTLYM